MTETTIKTALVTGAAKRIGRTLALDLAAKGWSIAAHYHRSRAEADDLVAEIQRLGQRAVALPADLSDAASTATLVPAAIAALGPLSLLVNNASLFENDNVQNATVAMWDSHMTTNLRAPFFLAQAFAAQLPAGTKGNIVNIIDQRVWKLNPFFASYTISKAALWTLTQTLAMGLAPHIRVNAIGPGPVLRNERQSEAAFEQQWQGMPLGRGSTPEECAAALRFILDAPAMTGQMIALDGGQHLPWPSQPSLDG